MAGTKQPVNPDIWAGVSNLPFTRGAQKRRAVDVPRPKPRKIREETLLRRHEEPLARDRPRDNSTTGRLVRRAGDGVTQTSYFRDLSLVSQPPNVDWGTDPNAQKIDPLAGLPKFHFHYHPTAGRGQYVYTIEYDIQENLLPVSEPLICKASKVGVDPSFAITPTACLPRCLQKRNSWVTYALGVKPWIARVVPDGTGRTQEASGSSYGT